MTRDDNRWNLFIWKETKILSFRAGGPKLGIFGPKLFLNQGLRVLFCVGHLFGLSSFSGVNSIQNICWYFSRLFDVWRKSFICISFKKFLRQLLAWLSPHDGVLLEGVENVNECCVSHPASHISCLFAIQSHSLACLSSHRLGRCSLLLNWIWTQINLMFSLAKLDLSFSSRWPEVFESSKGARDIRGQRESEPKKTGQLLLSLDHTSYLSQTPQTVSV